MQSAAHFCCSFYIPPEFPILTNCKGLFFLAKLFQNLDDGACFLFKKIARLAT